MKVEPLLSPRVLASVASMLEQSGFMWWVDQGSLLGLVRDGRFLDWDNDIDIGVWDVPNDRKDRLVTKLRKEFGVSYLDELNNAIKVFFYDSGAMRLWSIDIS